MNDLAKTATTRTEGWQAICLQWAQAREPFEVRGISARHLSFCRDLCERFNYKCNYDSGDRQRAAVFFPSD